MLFRCSELFDILTIVVDWARSADSRCLSSAERESWGWDVHTAGFNYLIQNIIKVDEIGQMIIPPVALHPLSYQASIITDRHVWRARLACCWSRLCRTTYPSLTVTFYYEDPTIVLSEYVFFTVEHVFIGKSKCRSDVWRKNWQYACAYGNEVISAKEKNSVDTFFQLVSVGDRSR